MDMKRMLRSARFILFFDQMKRADYARKKGIFHYVGKNVRLPAMLVPLHAEMIAFHDNVEVASGVRFVVHDAIHGVLNYKYHGVKDDPEFSEWLDCIEIMDNVFIGSGTIVLGGCRIGPNVIVGANSLVNTDLPAGTVCAGTPARAIGNFDELVARRREVRPFISADDAWARFLEQHAQQK